MGREVGRRQEAEAATRVANDSKRENSDKRFLLDLRIRKIKNF